MTCRRVRAQRQPPDPAIVVDLTDDDAMSTVDQGVYHANTAQNADEPPASGTFPDGPPTDQLALLDSQSPDNRISRAGNDIRRRRDSQLINEAFQTLHQVLPAGPETDALRAFKSSLDNLRHSIHLPTHSSSDRPSEAWEGILAGRSAESFNLDDIIVHRGLSVTTADQSYHMSGVPQNSHTTRWLDFGSNVDWLLRSPTSTIGTADVELVLPARIEPAKNFEFNPASPTELGNRIAEDAAQVRLCV